MRDGAGRVCCLHVCLLQFFHNDMTTITSPNTWIFLHVPRARPRTTESQMRSVQAELVQCITESWHHEPSQRITIDSVLLGLEKSFAGASDTSMRWKGSPSSSSPRLPKSPVATVSTPERDAAKSIPVPSAMSSVKIPNLQVWHSPPPRRDVPRNEMPSFPSSNPMENRVEGEKQALNKVEASRGALGLHEGRGLHGDAQGQGASGRSDGDKPKKTPFLGQLGNGDLALGFAM